ncbi:MAG TPA: hypothetical protein DEB39_00070 [Planctomycetaceae bacterium]|nr:hypothetical protein [Planctomycetaceae bacterium]
MKIARNFLVMGVFLVFSAMVFAQPGGPGQGGPGQGGPGRGPGRGPGGPGLFDGGFGLLIDNEDVKVAVGISEEQIEKLRTLRREDRPTWQPPSQDASPEAREQEFEKFRKAREEHRAKMKAVLTPEQSKKFSAVRFQLSGGLEEPRGPEFLESLEALDLTPEQKAKLDAFAQEQRKKAEQFFSSRNRSEGSPEERRAEIRAFFEKSQQEMKTEVNLLLTAEQKGLAAKLTQEGEGLRENLRQSFRDRERRPGRGEGRGERGYRPGADSWQPGRGAGNREERGNRDGNRRGFPRQAEESKENDQNKTE